MANQIVNAAPMVIDYGTQDLSTRQLPREPEFIPQHLPKFYLFAQKGPTEPQLVVGSERINTYGMETFNLRSKYSNHATVFANLVNAEGNSCMIQRLIPEDAGPVANLTVWLDVLPTTLNDYERNSDGSIKLDALLGTPIIAKDGSGNNITVAGHEVKWVVTHRTTDSQMQDTVTGFGSTDQQPGDQTDPVTGTTSTKYPIFELRTSSKGEYGNTVGIRLSAPTIQTVASMPSKMMNAHAAYPYFISIIKRPDALSSPKVVETLFGEQKLMVTFKPEVIDPVTDKRLYVGDILIDSYQNLVDLRYPKLFGEFDKLVVYQDNLNTVLDMFHAAEASYAVAAATKDYYDFSDNNNDKHLFNIVSGMTSQGYAYHTYRFVDSTNAVRFSEYTNVYAGGGSDGTMDEVVFNRLVRNEVNRYLDPNDFVQELAVNVESIIYDSGFELDTKYALCSFIANRKDTFLALATHQHWPQRDADDKVIKKETIFTASEEHSIAIALRTRMQMFPESDYFGTPVMRGMIIGRSGKLRNSQYQYYLPLTAEVAIKSAKYMGAGNGRWKNGFHFDGAPGSIVDYMYDINITWVPTGVRNRNWDVGLNWVQSYDRRSYFFPALKTIYDNDTSVLNSYFTAMAICQLNKVAHSAWREFTGISHLTNAQFAQRVNDFVISRIQKRFDERFVIVPDAFFTDMDLLRGFSWTLPIKIYAPNLMTVCTTYVQAYRMEDLESK